MLIASDTPTGTGVMPLALLKSIAELSSLGGLKPEDAIAMATGNVAQVYGLNTGKLEVGREADLVVLDAPYGSVADTALSRPCPGGHTGHLVGGNRRPDNRR